MSAFDFQLKAALVGDFDAELDLGRRRVAFAAMSAMRDGSTDLNARLQLDVASSRLANAAKLSKTWKVRQYPNTGLNPAAVISSKAPMLIEAFERGGEVRSAAGFWLTIPNPALRFKPRRSKGGRSIVAQYAARYGPLRFVFLKGRRDLALLVADLRRGKAGAYRKPTDAARRRGDHESTVILYLVPKARMPRLLRGQTIRDRAERDFPERFQRDFDRYLEQAERGQAQLGFQQSGGFE